MDTKSVRGFVAGAVATAAIFGALHYRNSVLDPEPSSDRAAVSRHLDEALPDESALPLPPKSGKSYRWSLRANASRGASATDMYVQDHDRPMRNRSRPVVGEQTHAPAEDTAPKLLVNEQGRPYRITSSQPLRSDRDQVVQAPPPPRDSSNRPVFSQPFGHEIPGGGFGDNEAPPAPDRPPNEVTVTGPTQHFFNGPTLTRRPPQASVAAGGRRTAGAQTGRSVNGPVSSGRTRSRVGRTQGWRGL